MRFFLTEFEAPCVADVARETILTFLLRSGRLLLLILTCMLFVRLRLLLAVTGLTC